MDSDERARRPKVERSGPIRNWTFGSRPVSDGPPPPEAEAPDAVGRAVELGYRVVDEYIRLGQRAARGFTDGGLSGGDVPRAWQDASARIGQLTAEWMGMWFELAQRAATGAWAMAGAPPAGHTNPTPAPSDQADATARVRVVIEAQRPVEVALDVQPASVGAPLVIHALRAVDAALPRLEDTRFTPATPTDSAVLSIRIPADHPAGTYSGAIVDASSNRPVGLLSVRIP